ncbi:MAG TPA: NUDIX domain-containing protein [Candidatus Dormibacteraeota bacterium]|jgi:8-oxo-dGTP diphosphatase|nr:NUDIX domain-containing protein [Candidatus Dormibacteraeota bacterium]
MGEPPASQPRPVSTTLRARFCPRCATELGERDVEGKLLPACDACDYIAFRDPKVVAVTVLSDGPGGIWLIRRGIEPRVGEWALPGGYVDYDEHPRAAARRECQEEIGCEVEIDRLVGVHHANLVTAGVVIVAYAGRIVAGTPRACPEVLEVRRFALDELPPLAFSTHSAIVREWRWGPEAAPTP